MAEIKDYNMPDELYYHTEHAWVKVEGDKVRIGMNEFYGKTSGDATYIDLPSEDDEVEAGETIGKIQSAKWVGKLVSPVSGEVVEVNEELEDTPTLINTSPYDEGWILLLEPSNLDDELEELLHGDKVTPWLEKEIERAEKEQS
jgi:glycine cleavage system H protein